MSIGVVIGSYGMPSCVALNIAAIMHSNPWDVPILVHDDCTPVTRDPTGFFRQEPEGYELYRTPRQLGHVAGDVSCFVNGLKWAERRKLEYVVKVSQRFVMYQFDWLNAAVRQAQEDGAITLAQVAAHGAYRPWGYDGIRTECVVMRTADWNRPEIYQFVEDARVTPEVTFKVAAELHVGKMARWRAVPADKAEKRSGILWHDSNPESDYAALADKLGVLLKGYSNAAWRILLGNRYFMS
jgi:hypothetical protein